jgi:hypothetical protein
MCLVKKKEIVMLASWRVVKEKTLALGRKRKFYLQKIAGNIIEAGRKQKRLRAMDWEVHSEAS